jgi:WD40 repeat protein
MEETYEIFYVTDVGLVRRNEQNGHSFNIITKENRYHMLALTNDTTKLVCAEFTRIIIYDVDTGDKFHFLESHKRDITCLVISPDDLTIVSGGRDDNVMVWDLLTGKLQMTLKGHEGTVISVAIIPKTVDKIASGSTDKTVRIWAFATGELLFTLKGHTNWTRNVIFTPDGQHVISTSDDKSIRVWSVENGGHVSTINVESPVLSLVVTSSGDKVFCSTYTNFVSVYNLHTQQLIRKMDVPRGAVIQVIITPDEQHILGIQWDGFTVKWIMESGEKVQNFTCLCYNDCNIVCCPSALFSDGDIELRFSGRIVDTSLKKIVYKVNLQTRVETNDNLVSIYEEELLVANIKASNAASAFQFKSWIYAVKHHIGSPIEQRAKTGNQLMNRYKADWLQTMNILESVEKWIFCRDMQFILSYTIFFKKLKKIFFLKKFNTCILILLWNNKTSTNYIKYIFIMSGQLVWHNSSEDGRTKKYDMDTGECLQVYHSLPLNAQNSYLSSDGSILVTTYFDGKIIICDADTGEQLQVFESDGKKIIICLAIGTDNSTIFFSQFNNFITVWDVLTNKIKMKLTGHDDYVLSMAISPAGDKIASGSADETVCVWSLLSADSGKLLFRLRGHDDWVRCVRFNTGRGNNQIISGSQDRTVMVWNVENGVNVNVINVADCVYSLYVSSSGDKIICGCSNGEILLYTLETRHLIRKILYSRAILTVAITPDEKHVIGRSNDDKITKWRVDDGSISQEFYFDRLYSCDIAESPGSMCSDFGVQLRFNGRIVDTTASKIVYQVGLQTRVETMKDVVLFYEEEIVVAKIKTFNPSSALEWKHCVLAIKNQLGLPREKRPVTKSGIVARFKADWLQTMNILECGRVDFLPRHAIHLITQNILN